MAEISVGSAIGAGFELIGKRPLTVLTWGLVRVGLVAVILALYAPTLIGVFAEIAAKSQTGLKPSEADMQQMMSHFALMQGASALLNIVNLLVGSVSSALSPARSCTPSAAPSPRCASAAPSSMSWC
jgi:hypothetical protein